MTSVPADQPHAPISAPEPVPGAEEPHAAADPIDHRHARAKRRRSRRRHRRHMMSAAVIGVLVGVAGAALGVAGAVSFVGTRDEQAAVRAEAADKAEFVGMCEARIRGIDCGCIWEDARPAFLPDTRDAVLTLIAQRDAIPLRVQRIRTERLLGPELGKQVWAAAYYCVKD